jgi:hypothetical protein
MKRRAAARDGVGEELPVGTVVHLALADVDRAKLDHTNATLVLVEQAGLDSYRVADRAGVHNSAVSRAHLRPLPMSTPELVGLSDVLLSWRGLSKVGIRQVAASLSPAGELGLVHCACKGSYMAGKCVCLKAGRRCNSRCHKGNKKCKNHA